LMELQKAFQRRKECVRADRLVGQMVDAIRMVQMKAGLTVMKMACWTKTAQRMVPPRADSRANLKKRELLMAHLITDLMESYLPHLETLSDQEHLDARLVSW